MKKQYSKPKLVRYGSIQDITLTRRRRCGCRGLRHRRGCLKGGGGTKLGS